MSKLPSIKTATNGIIIILTAVVIFHLLVISGIIPYAIVWGGRITSQSQLILMESISIAINLIMLTVVFCYRGILNIKFNAVILRICFWVMFILFLLNTIGNLASKNNMETYIFTPLTFLLSIFCFKIAVFGFPKSKT